MKQCPNSERRAFLLNAAASLGVVLSSSALASLLSSCENDTTKPSTTGQKVEFDITTEPALGQVGGVVKQSFGSNNGGMPVFIVRSGETSFLVLSSRCSHDGCEVDLPSLAGGNLVCPCHLAEYDPLSGVQTKPPRGQSATGPLKKFDATYDANRKILTITF